MTIDIIMQVALYENGKIPLANSDRGMYNTFIGGEDLALTKEDLQAIGALMDSKLDSKLEPINTRLDTIESKQDTMSADLARLDTMQEDIEIIKEESTITRSMTNRLLKWAEKADRTAVNVGFDETE